MATILKNTAFSLAAVALVASFVPSFAAAQTTTAQVVVVTQVSSGVTPMSGTVTVNATGPTLTGYVGNSNSLTFSANFNGDSHPVTMAPGNYTITSPTYTNQTVTYSSDCSGFVSAGQTRTCTITANVGQSGNSRVNVSLSVINNVGGNKVAGDFTVSVSGNNVNVPTFTGTTGTTQVTLGSGGYSIDIQNPRSYAVSRSADCSGTINSGDTRSCVITLTQSGTSYNNTGSTYYVNGSTCYWGTYYPIGSTCYTGNTYNYNNGIYNPNGVYYLNGSTCYYGTVYYNGSNCYTGSNTTYAYGTGSTYYSNGTLCYYGTNYAVGSNCYNGNTYPVNYYPSATDALTCAPSSQTVDNGETASFTAYGASGPFTWSVDGRTFFAIGPKLNTVLSGPGVHTVSVSNGVKTASCTVTVTNKQYAVNIGGIVLGAANTVPGLPNTGYGPNAILLALALLGALVALPLAFLMAYSYAKKTGLTNVR